MLPPAVDELRRQGEDYVAELFEISSVVGPLLAMARFDEHDNAIAAMVDRYRARGPPTFLHWTLFMLGYSALFQGRHEQAKRFFDESANVDVPERTISLNKPIEARAALRRGNPTAAFQILRSHIDELLETDNLAIGSLAAAEFVNMMVKIDHLPEAARILGCLETTGTFGPLSSTNLRRRCGHQGRCQLRGRGNPRTGPRTGARPSPRTPVHARSTRAAARPAATVTS